MLTKICFGSEVVLAEGPKPARSGRRHKVKSIGVLTYE
jgi:hypothetical protein